jgi:hypothetical protein
MLYYAVHLAYIKRTKYVNQPIVALLFLVLFVMSKYDNVFRYRERRKNTDSN